MPSFLLICVFCWLALRTSCHDSVIDKDYPGDDSAVSSYMNSCYSFLLAVIPNVLGRVRVFVFMKLAWNSVIFRTPISLTDLNGVVVRFKIWGEEYNSKNVLNKLANLLYQICMYLHLLMEGLAVASGANHLRGGVWPWKTHDLLVSEAALTEVSLKHHGRCIHALSLLKHWWKPEDSKLQQLQSMPYLLMILCTVSWVKIDFNRS